MVLTESFRGNGLWRAVLGAAIAGLGTCVVAGFGWWSARTGGMHLLSEIAAVLVLTAIGATAGRISGRFRDAPVSLAGAVIGAALAYQANYTIDPSWPRSETLFAVWLVYAAVFLLPFIAGGHLLGAWAANRSLRGARARRT